MPEMRPLNGFAVLSLNADCTLSMIFRTTEADAVEAAQDAVKDGAVKAVVLTGRLIDPARSRSPGDP